MLTGWSSRGWRPTGGRGPPYRPTRTLALSWFRAFHADAAEQAGRLAPEPAGEQFDEADIGRRIAEGRIWLWEDGLGTPVSLVGFNAPSFGVARVGPVYTPGPHRGRGYASVLTAHVSRVLRDTGRAGLPVHRPGQPDLEQDLRRDRLRAGRRHGQPGHQPAGHHTSTGLTTAPLVTSATAWLTWSAG